MTPPRSRRERRRTLSFLLALLVLGLRVLYLPVHIVQEEHLGPGGQPGVLTAKAFEQAKGHPHEHRHGHSHEHGDSDPGDEHPSHPAFDHGGELIVNRIGLQLQGHELPAWIALDADRVRRPEEGCALRAPAPRPPRWVQGETQRQRGPPAAA